MFEDDNICRYRSQVYPEDEYNKEKNTSRPKTFRLHVASDEYESSDRDRSPLSHGVSLVSWN